MISVNDIEGPLGVRISGCDLSRLADDADFRVIHEAFLGRHVASLAGQRLTPEQLIDFSRRLGPLEPHVLAQHHLAGYPEIIVLSNIVENGQPLGLADAGTYWHSDISYKARPSRTTVLYALEVPAEGGDTLFANLEAAYQGLSAPMKDRLDGLQAIHNYAYRHDRLACETGIRSPLTAAQLAETPAVTHPIVRTHPETGRKALYINPGFTMGIEGLAELEGNSLMQELFDHCLKPEYCYRYHWEQGDVVFWDNASVMHSATTQTLDPGKRRLIWRTIVSGEEPV